MGSDGGVNLIKIAEGYGISFDKKNAILNERYEKREGKGRNAPLSGEYGYREVSYHNTLEEVGNKLVKMDVMAYEGSELEEAVNKIAKLRDEIVETLKEKIVINRGEG
jgi:hypothetical protein